MPSKSNKKSAAPAKKSATAKAAPKAMKAKAMKAKAPALAKAKASAKAKKAAAPNAAAAKPNGFMWKLLERKEAALKAREARTKEGGGHFERIHAQGGGAWARFNGPRRKAA